MPVRGDLVAVGRLQAQGVGPRLAGIAGENGHLSSRRQRGWSVAPLDVVLHDDLVRLHGPGFLWRRGLLVIGSREGEEGAGKNDRERNQETLLHGWILLPHRNTPFRSTLRFRCHAGEGRGPLPAMPQA